MELIERAKDENAKHLYDVEVIVNGEKCLFPVEANNRTQAASIAKKRGYVICSVNLIG